MENKLQTIYEGLCSCAVFYQVTEKAVFKAYEGYCLAKAPLEKRKAYTAFVAEIYRQGGNLTALVERLVSEDENTYIKGVAAKVAVDGNIGKSVLRELALLSKFASLQATDFAADMGVSVEELPGFTSVNADMVASYKNRIDNLHKYGYGIFSSVCMFRLSDDKKIEAIVSADKISIAQFIGYEREREKIVANTRAFVEGRPAANALLCGDAGTGKSSTVKAVANAFFDEGVRLIELRKDQLRYLPLVMAKISGNP